MEGCGAKVHVCFLVLSVAAASEDPGGPGPGGADVGLQLGGQRAAQDPAQNPQEQPCEPPRHMSCNELVGQFYGQAMFCSVMFFLQHFHTHTRTQCTNGGNSKNMVARRYK